jgi:hypothetical protein
VAKRRARRLELEPPPHRPQTERSLANVRVGHARSVVLNDAHERSVRPHFGAHDDLARAVSARERAVLDRVLDERLKQEPRQHCAAASRRDFPPETQRAAVASLEDLRVTAEPCHLLLDGLHHARVLHGVAQEVPQAHDEPARLARILRHEPRDGVERIEQKVRLEMDTQPFELRFAAQLLRLERAHARAFDRQGIDEGERPEAEIELRIEDAEP